jgi:hypothetical protein
MQIGQVKVNGLMVVLPFSLVPISYPEVLGNNHMCLDPAPKQNTKHWNENVELFWVEALIRGLDVSLKEKPCLSCDNFCATFCMSILFSMPAPNILIYTFILFKKELLANKFYL